MAKLTMTRWMGAAALAGAGILAGCASSSTMHGTEGGTAGAGGTAGSVNTRTDSAAGTATDTSAVRATNPVSANPNAYPSTGGAAMSFNNLGSDANIASAIDVSNSDEIAAGQLASSRATNAGVRSFAQRMVTDHTKMQQQDRAFLSGSGVSSTDSAGAALALRQQDDSAMASLRNATGAQFDAMYIDQQVTAHRRTLALLNAAKSQAQSSQLRDAIAGAIPQVQSHLDQAIALQKGMGTSGR